MQVGTARLQLRTPTAAYQVGPNSTLFCGSGTAQYTGPGAAGPLFSKLPCRYLDSYDAVFPALEAGNMFVCTRLTERFQALEVGAMPPNRLVSTP
jgi:hypothetical protein